MCSVYVGAAGLIAVGSVASGLFEQPFQTVLETPFRGTRFRHASRDFLALLGAFVYFAGGGSFYV